MDYRVKRPATTSNSAHSTERLYEGTLATPAPTQSLLMTHHHLHSSPETCHWGFFEARLKPVLTIASGDEVAAKKPAPDIYALALNRLGLTPDRALAFEDSRNGLLSARAVGLSVIVTPSVYTEDEDFADALQVLPELGSLEEIDRLFSTTRA